MITVQSRFKTMTNYHAYLIRLWREDKQAPWRGELVSPHTGEQRLFATIDQLLIFLTAQVENDAAAEQQEKTEHEKSRD
jgi:hypothetical protein